MQTVSPVVSAGAGAAPPGAAESAAADGVFPAAMTQAMSPSPGKAPPPAVGKALPVVLAEVGTVPPAAPDGTGGEGDAPTQSMSPGGVPGLDGEPPAAVQTWLPPVTDALQDISAGRAAAPRAEAADAQVADAETAVSELLAPADRPVGDRPQKPAGRRAADEPAVPSPPGMVVATDPMSLPAVRPPADPAPRAVAAEATAKAREQVTQRPAADQAHGLMAREQAAASPAPLARPVSAAAGPATAPTAAAVAANAGVTERVLTADPPLPVTGMDAGPVATPALAPAGVGVPAPAPAPAVTVQVPEFSLAATPGSAQFGSQLGDRVLWLVREGMHEARLQLNPRELGPVEVRLSVGDGAAQVSFSAQHAGTATAVQQSLPQLRDLLAQQGLQLGQAAVFHQPAGDGDAGRQQQAASGQSGWHGGGGRGAALDDTVPALPARLLGRGLVDAYA